LPCVVYHSLIISLMLIQSIRVCKRPRNCNHQSFEEKLQWRWRNQNVPGMCICTNYSVIGSATSINFNQHFNCFVAISVLRVNLF
jgi:hypothetical protein